jgi:hypothetical protein
MAVRNRGGGIGWQKIDGMGEKKRHARGINAALLGS